MAYLGYDPMEIARLAAQQGRSFSDAAGRAGQMWGNGMAALGQGVGAGLAQLGENKRAAAKAENELRQKQRLQDIVDQRELEAGRGAEMFYRPPEEAFQGSRTKSLADYVTAVEGQQAGQNYTPITASGDDMSIPTKPIGNELQAQAPRDLRSYVESQPVPTQLGYMNEKLTNIRDRNTDQTRGDGRRRTEKMVLGDRVIVFDKDTNEIIREEQVGARPRVEQGPGRLIRSDLNDKVEYTDPLTGKVVRTSPKGFRPGTSPSDIKGKAIAESEAKRFDPIKRGKAGDALKSLERKSNLVNEDIGKALELISPMSTGAGRAFSYLPWETDASQLEGLLSTIKANIGFDELSEMRQNSPTGGALGAINTIELELLQAVEGALNTKNRELLKENLERISSLYPQMLEERRAAFQRDYGDESDPLGLH